MKEAEEQGVALARISDALSDARWFTEGVSGLLGSATEATNAGLWLRDTELFVLAAAVDKATAKLDEAAAMVEALRGTEATAE